jgi:hypothetical protein
MMRSRDFLRRLDKLRITAQEEPTMDYDFGVLPRVEYARFRELYETLSIEGERTTEAERGEFRDLLNRCPLVDPSEAGNPYAESYEQKRERRLLERAFAGAFHDYARQYPYIAVPNYGNALNEYRLDIGYRLFGKYGWTPGERDCSEILPLDQWEPDDRDALIDLYQRANPECPSNAPPGWKSNYNGRVRF